MRTLVPSGDFPEFGLPELTFNSATNHIHNVDGLSSTDKDLTFGNSKSADEISRAHLAAEVILNQIDLVLE
ncbi:MAG TPA: hypothetical protein VLF39_03285 [Candidatus Saccharimonadales bacterium]|nr:hypothetical protein [Candidatus Saccharimonadales bacterium]